MYTELHDDHTEKKILALLCTKPTYLKALELDVELFQVPENIALASLFISYIKKYQTPPTEDALKGFIKDIAKDTEDLDKKYALIEVFLSLPEANPDEAPYWFSKAEDLLCGRKLYSFGEEIQVKLESGKDSYKKVLQGITHDILSISSMSSNVRRGYVNSKESIEKRAKNYLDAKRGKTSSLVPYGIKILDNFFGGMKRSFLTLIYSKTGGGKTRTMMNIAISSSLLGTRVLYLTLEMDFDLVGSCFDSRVTLLDSHDIIFGKLQKEGENTYRDHLKRLKEKSPENDIWLVDIPEGATTITIRKEIETYKALHGYYPDLVIIDYAHLVEPLRKYTPGDRSTRFDNLFEEFHKMARAYNVAIITAVQESREKSKAEAKKKKNDEEDQEGTHNIGASNYIAPHCETIMRLKQTWEDYMQNRLFVYSDKNRTGKTGRLELVCIWKLTYVGDRCPELDRFLPNASVLKTN